MTATDLGPHATTTRRVRVLTSLIHHLDGYHATVVFVDGTVLRGGLIWRPGALCGAVIVPPLDDARDGEGIRRDFHLDDIISVSDSETPDDAERPPDRRHDVKTRRTVPV